MIDGQYIADPAILQILADYERRMAILEAQLDELRHVHRVKLQPDQPP